MKTNQTFIPLVILLVTFIVTGDANNFVFASPDYDRMNIELSEPSKIIKKHTVRDNENLTVIGKKYNTSVARITDLNNLENPNFVIAGQDLMVEFLENKTIRVIPSASKPLGFPQGRKVVEHVIYPDKDNVFAPSTPTVVYEIVEAEVYTKPKESIGQSKTFKSLMAFFKWLNGSDYSKETKGAGTNHVNPSSSSPFYQSPDFKLDTPTNQGLSIYSHHTFFDSYISDSLSPPPKQA